MSTTERPPAENGVATGPPGRWHAVGLVARAVQVRLRFVAVLAAAFLVVGNWESIRNRWERLTRGLTGSTGQATAVSTDTEYFCPMDPGVLSDWPGKCGVCNMSLVRRRKGEATPLPSGVVARMQISPYRIQLAGVRTVPVSYAPLARVEELPVTALGGNAKEGWTLSIDSPGRDSAFEGRGTELILDTPAVRAGTPVKVRSAVDRDGHTCVVVEGDIPGIHQGARGRLKLRQAIADLEPFRSLPADPPSIRKGEPRSVYECPEHAEVLKLEAGKCPVDAKDPLESRPLLANQRVAWWCPMHPKVTADKAGEKCEDCGGMVLVPRVITYRPAGEVLRVPESAVVDTGTRTVVYVERMPGMFDGVEVGLGPRCGDEYPVASGLEPGQRVAMAGTFLIDAETRLNPSLAAAYFGASRGDSAPRSGAANLTPPTAELPPDLKALVDAQKLCPVTRKPLGSMGVPIRVSVAGRTVLVCCEGCEGPLTRSPEKYLARLNPENKEPAPSRPAGGP